MKVILTQDVPKLGKAGEVKEVKKGYGFNYLLPEGLAELATPGAVKSVNARMAKRSADQKATAAEQAKKVEAVSGTTVTLRAKAADGKLFGSVTKAAIADVLGNGIEADMIALEHPIKEVGEYTVSVEAAGKRGSVKLSVIAE